MTDTLGDRIRAHRDQRHAAAKEHIDKQSEALKSYVDDQIAKLCADNNLTPPS